MCVRSIFLVVLVLSGCGQPAARGAKHTGEPCERDTDCTHGLCVAGVAGRDGRCTVSCGSTSDCPNDWSCSGVTQQGVLVCSRQAATPFGNGNGH